MPEHREAPPVELEREVRRLATDKVENGKLFLVWPGPKPMTAAAANLDLVARILADGSSSRLVKRLVLDLKLAQNVDVYFDELELAGVPRPRPGNPRRGPRGDQARGAGRAGRPAAGRPGCGRAAARAGDGGDGLPSADRGPQPPCRHAQPLRLLLRDARRLRARPGALPRGDRGERARGGADAGRGAGRPADRPVGAASVEKALDTRPGPAPAGSFTRPRRSSSSSRTARRSRSCRFRAPGCSPVARSSTAASGVRPRCRD